LDLSYNPAAHAQTVPAGEPEVNVQGTKVAPAPPPPTYPPPPAHRPVYVPSGFVQPPASGPVVTMRADTEKARLQAQTQLTWRDVCITPCNLPVDPAGVYRVGGDSINPSDTFRMPRPSGRVVVDVQYGSKIKRGVGIALIIAGLVNAALGVYAFSNADELSRNDPNGKSADYYNGIGVGSMIHGAVVAGVGVAYAISSTSIEVH
jgi:hypothetical protein